MPLNNGLFMKHTLPTNGKTTLNRKGTDTIKHTCIGRILKGHLVLREEAEDNAIIARFIKVLLTSQATRADLLDALKPTSNSTLTADLFNVDGTPRLFNEDGTPRLFNADGTLIIRSLVKPFRNAYRQAEDIKKAEFEKAFAVKFAEKQEHSIDELIKLDAICRRMEHPFKGKFNEAEIVQAA